MACAQAAPPPAPSPHKNLVLVSMDTCRADRVATSSYERNTSPSTWRLAQAGTRFTMAWAQSNQTLYSHSAMFTGRYPGSLHVVDENFAIPSGVDTLPLVLKAYGYQTAAFVGGAHMKGLFGFERGFDLYEDDHDFGSFYHTVPAATRWVQEHKDRPFFLLVHGYDCHSNYHRPLFFDHLYDADYSGIAEDIATTNFGIERIYKDRYYYTLERTVERTNEGRRTLSDGFFRDAVPQAAARGAPSLQLTPRDEAHLVAHYDGAVTYADAWVGVLMARLEDAGVLESSMVVVLADHGEDLGESGYWHHAAELQDNTWHIPLVIYAPSLQASLGRQVDDIVEAVDLLPTMLQFAGATPPAGIAGQSLLAQMTGAGEGRQRRYAHAEGWGQRIVRGRTAQLLEDEDRGLVYTALAEPVAPQDSEEELKAALKTWSDAWLSKGSTAPLQIDADLRQTLKDAGYW